MAQMVNARAHNAGPCIELGGGEASADRPGVQQLFRDHGGFVLRLVRRLGIASAEVEDVAQEVFLQVHNTRERMRPDVAERSWLFGIVRRVVANHRRKSRRQASFLSALKERESRQVGDAAPYDERWLLDQALDRLESDKREVFVLFELEGLPMKEVAQLVGCPLQTAYSRLYAARFTVQAFVLGHGPDGGPT